MSCRCIRFISDEEYLDSTLTAANLRPVKWSPEKEQKKERTMTRGSTPSPTTTEATRMKKTGSRSRAHVATGWEGRLLPNEEGPTHNGRATILRSLNKPRRDGIITQEMSDPNLTNNGVSPRPETTDSSQGPRRRPCTDRASIPYLSYHGRARRTRPSPVAGGQTPRC